MTMTWRAKCFAKLVHTTETGVLKFPSGLNPGLPDFVDRGHLDGESDK